ncbi:MAG: hypothetical protein DMG65_25315 [Candidatus Angelobacter sp. Gp1-AA117]|nr:MAG: hypothetical protein DMG65_25315 [Candidatus Angelobacter sp. Gp1-AA117]
MAAPHYHNYFYSRQRQALAHSAVQSQQLGKFLLTLKGYADSSGLGDGGDPLQLTKPGEHGRA